MGACGGGIPPPMDITLQKLPLLLCYKNNDDIYFPSLPQMSQHSSVPSFPFLQLLRPLLHPAGVPVLLLLRDQRRRRRATQGRPLGRGERPGGEEEEGGGAGQAQGQLGTTRG